MIDLEDLTKRFWSAAFFCRRARYRDRTTAIAILQHITETTTGKVRNRALEIVKEYDVKSGSAQE